MSANIVQGIEDEIIGLFDNWTNLSLLLRVFKEHPLLQRLVY